MWKASDGLPMKGKADVYKRQANEQYRDAVFFADRGTKEKFDQTVQKAYETFMHQQTDLDEEPEEAEELEQEEGGMNMGM